MSGVVVLGIGNILMQDEGVGVHAVRALSDGGLPEGVAAVDGGTLGLELLPIVEEAGALVLVDAARMGRAPGSFGVFRGGDLFRGYGGHVSPHQAGAADLIAAARLTGGLPERCTLFGVEPGAIDFGLELSAEVAAALPEVVLAVMAEAEALREVARDA